VTVGLYTLEDTLDIFTGAPYYFAKTNDEGYYHFRNIKDGIYRLYAFQDGNKNLTCQSANEAYAFLSEPIVLDTVQIADTLRLEFMNIDTLELSRVRSSGRYFNVLANKYLIDAQLQASNDSTLFYHFNDDHDGLVLYNSFPIKDSLAVYLSMQDSLREIVRDTFYLKFPETSRRPNEFKINQPKIAASFADKMIEGEITYSKPIKEIRLDSVVIFYDSLSSYPLAENFAYSIDSLNNKLDFTASIPQAVIDTIIAQRDVKPAGDLQGKAKARRAKHKLAFKQGAFISIEQDSSALIEKELSFIDASTTGVITGQINSAFVSFFVQLLDTKFTVIQEAGAGANYRFAGIKPGEYLIRVLIDANNNGVWEHSDIRINRMAEPIVIHKDEKGNNKTAVRANWELTVDLNF
jgi:hypothetical protein